MTHRRNIRSIVVIWLVIMAVLMTGIHDRCERAIAEGFIADVART
jgi:hypothetical protein